MARFFKLTPDISVQYWLEFLGEKAVTLINKLLNDTPANIAVKILTEGVSKENLKEVLWTNPLRLSITIFSINTEKELEIHIEPGRTTSGGKELSETARVYLIPHDLSGRMPNNDILIAFAAYMLTPILHDAGISEDFAKLQFKRENGARIIHYRPSDENPFLGGFGEKNPRTGKECHRDFSEPFVDREPGTAFTKYQDGIPVGEEVWRGFDPVYLKVKPADGRDGYFLGVRTEWDGPTISVLATVSQEDVPQELRDYEFPAKNKSRGLDEFEEAAIKKYAPSQKFTHSPRFKK